MEFCFTNCHKIKISTNVQHLAENACYKIFGFRIYTFTTVKPIITVPRTLTIFHKCIVEWHEQICHAILIPKINMLCISVFKLLCSSITYVNI